MRIGKDEPSLTIDDDTGTEAGPFLTALETRIKKISEKRIEKGVHAKSGKWIALCLDLIFGTDIDNGRADFLNGTHDRVTAARFMTAAVHRETEQKQEHKQKPIEV